MDLGMLSECDIILELYSKHRRFYVFKEIQYGQYKICTYALDTKIKCAQNHKIPLKIYLHTYVQQHILYLLY